METETSRLGSQDALCALLQARVLLETETPLKKDCGKLCAGACCRTDEGEENGMWLFPHEETLYQDPIEGFPFRLEKDETVWPGGCRLICEGSCLRAHRPLACRLFPLRLRPAACGTGISVEPEIDPRAWALCPLPEQCGGRLNALQGSFVQSVRTAGDLLVRNADLLVFLNAEQQWLDETRVL